VLSLEQVKRKANNTTNNGNILAEKEIIGGNIVNADYQKTKNAHIQNLYQMSVIHIFQNLQYFQNDTMAQHPDTPNRKMIRSVGATQRGCP